MLSSVEVSKLEAGVNDASRSLHQFCIGGCACTSDVTECERVFISLQTTPKRVLQPWPASSLLHSAPCLVAGSSWSRLLKVHYEEIHLSLG